MRSLVHAITRTPTKRSLDTTLFSKAAMMTKGIRGAFFATSLSVPRTTMALSTQSFNMRCRPKHSDVGCPERDSTQRSAAQKDAGNDTGQPSARRKLR